MTLPNKGRQRDPVRLPQRWLLIFTIAGALATVVGAAGTPVAGIGVGIAVVGLLHQVVD
jgi:hypothetical protein